MEATPAQETSIPAAAMSRSAGPLTVAPRMIGLTATTCARRACRASRTPGRARIGPTEITGFDGQSRMASASARASSTPGPGRASAAPSKRTAATGGWARSRTNHSCIAILTGSPPSRGSGGVPPIGAA
jgi:hypothetical protein